MTTIHALILAAAPAEAGGDLINLDGWRTFAAAIFTALCLVVGIVMLLPAHKNAVRKQASTVLNVVLAAVVMGIGATVLLLMKFSEGLISTIFG